MKITSRIGSLMLIVTIAAFYSGCKEKDDDKKSAEEVQLDKLKGVWAVTGVMNDGTSRMDEWTGVVLTLGGNYANDGGTYNYSFTGNMPNPSPWPRNGFWHFGADVTDTIIRDSGVDEVTMQYAVTDETLEISFDLDPSGTGWDPGAGRISSVAGNWTFTFARQ